MVTVAVGTVRPAAPPTFVPVLPLSFAPVLPLSLPLFELSTTWLWAASTTTLRFGSGCGGLSETPGNVGRHFIIATQAGAMSR